MNPKHGIGKGTQMAKGEGKAHKGVIKGDPIASNMRNSALPKKHSSADPFDYPPDVLAKSNRAIHLIIISS